MLHFLGDGSLTVLLTFRYAADLKLTSLMINDTVGLLEISSHTDKNYRQNK